MENKVKATLLCNELTRLTVYKLNHLKCFPIQDTGVYKEMPGINLRFSHLLEPIRHRAQGPPPAPDAMTTI